MKQTPAVSRADIAKSARTLIGSRWHHQGRSISAGIDCIGCIIYVALDTGLMTQEQIDLLDVPDYSRRPDAYELLVKILKENLIEIPINTATEGDVLTFRLPGEKLTSHVAFLLKGEREYTLIHSLEKKITTEEIYRKWDRFVTGAFRFKGVIE